MNHREETANVRQDQESIVNGYMRFLAQEDQGSIVYGLKMGAAKYADGLTQVRALADGVKETPTPSWIFK